MLGSENEDYRLHMKSNYSSECSHLLTGFLLGNYFSGAYRSCSLPLLLQPVGKMNKGKKRLGTHMSGPAYSSTHHIVVIA